MQAVREEGGAGRYVQRECKLCLRGEIYTGSPTELRKVPCPSCGGTRRTKAFLYPKPKGFRGEWPPETAAREEG